MKQLLTETLLEICQSEYVSVLLSLKQSRRAKCWENTHSATSLLPLGRNVIKETHPKTVYVGNLMSTADLSQGVKLDAYQFRVINKALLSLTELCRGDLLGVQFQSVSQYCPLNSQKIFLVTSHIL